MAARSDAESAQMQLTWEPQRRVFTVSELNSAVQHLFGSEFANIWVAGEISGCRNHPSGHYYFSLKDGQSQIRAVLFKGTARFAKFKPQDGMSALARGRLEVYEPRGEYQLVVDLLEPQGAGALQLAFEQLKKKLATEGLFDAGKKRGLPKLPWRIGIVTSPGGAVIRDVLRVLDRRFSGLHVRLFPAQVQGEGSAQQVCDGLRHFGFSDWAQVVIVARGGGSLEDLWTFNEESVARAIAACRVPVISAIGHETDFTIADFVADLRAPTPSAAAEMVICTKESLFEQLEGHRSKAMQAMRYRLVLASRDLHRRGVERANSVVQRAISKRAQQLDEMQDRTAAITRRLHENRARVLVDLGKRLEAANLHLRFTRTRHGQELLEQKMIKVVGTRFVEYRRRHDALQAQLMHLSPLAVLGRGYAIVSDKRGRIIRAANETVIGERVEIRLHSGTLSADVSAIESDQQE